MWAAAVLFYFSLAVAGQALIRRLKWFRNSVFDFLFSGCVFGAGLIAHYFLDPSLASSFWAGVLCYAFLSELYLFLFTFTKSSVGVSILRGLEKGPMTESRLDAMLCPADMVENRLRVMVEAGFLEQENLNYQMTQKGRCLTACFQWMKAIFKKTETL